MKIILTLLILVNMSSTAMALTEQEINNKQVEATVDSIVLQYQQYRSWEQFLYSIKINLQNQLNASQRYLIISGVNWPGQDLSKSTSSIDWTKY